MNDPMKRIIFERNKKLTKGEIKILIGLVNGKDLVQSIPGGWYMENDRVSGKTCFSLIRKVYISEEGYSEEKFKHYYINEDGRNAIKEFLGK